MSVILEVAIGLIFLYMMLALIATTFQELIASVLRLRAKHLYDALAGMLKGEIQLGPTGSPKRIIEALYEHPLIRNLCKTAPRFEDGKLVSRGALPSYIPSQTFALALLDVLRGDTSASHAIGAREVLLKAGDTLDNIANNDDLQRNLKLLLAGARGQLDKLDETAAHVSKCVETLFNDRMARASGWYKRQAQWIALLIALVIAAVANADTIYVAARLWTDDALRSSVVQSAQHFHDARVKAQEVPASSTAGAGTPSAAAGSAGADEVAAAAKKFGKSIQDLETAGFPIGWPRPIGSYAEFLMMLAGWLITAFAVSLGSNFWFDILSKALQIRGGGPKVSAVTGRVGPTER